MAVEHVCKYRSGLRVLQAPQRLPHFVRNTPAASRVSDVTNFEAVELACCADSIRPHVVKSEPISNT